MLLLFLWLEVGVEGFRVVLAWGLVFLTRGLLIFIPEEVLALGEFFFLCFGGEDGFEGVGVVTGVEHLGGGGHGCRGEILHLFEFVAHLSG